MTTQLVSIGNYEIPIVQYQNQPVVTFAMIDKVHQRPDGTARKRFAENRSRFSEGKHFYVVDSKGLSAMRTEFPGVFGANAPQATLVTERGYLKLVKTFSDDLAWDVQDLLIDGYFRAKTTPVVASNQPVDLDYWIQQNQILGAAMIELRTQRQISAAIQQDVEAVKADMSDIKALLPTVKTHTTIRSYAATHNIKLHPKVAQRLGKRCAHITLNQGKAINPVPDDLYGTVNAYPNVIVEQVFTDELNKMKEAA